MYDSLRRRSLLFLFMILFLSNTAADELYEISLGTIHVIYEQEYEQTAREVTADLDRVLTAYREILKAPMTFDWPVILNSESSSPSGYVSLPLARTVWEMTPYDDFSLGPEWFHLLALHEGRHMVQYETLNSGITGISRILGGNQLMTTLTHAQVPGWIFEGDAVVSETLYSHEGRGRSADFERRFRALLDEDPYVSWEELSNGSYIHNMPNHYVYGYYLMGYLLNEYGIEAAGILLRTIGKYPVPFLSTTIGLSAVTGEFMTPQRLFDRVKADLLENWDTDGESYHEHDLIYAPEREGYGYIADYLYEDSGLSVLSYDRSEGLQLKEIDGDGVKPITSIPSSAADISSEYVGWIEHRSELFDSETTKAVLAVYDRKNRRFHDIAEGLYTGRPVIYGDEISVLAFDPVTYTLIETYDIAEGELLERITFPTPLYLSEIIRDGELFYGVAQSSDGRRILRIYPDGEVDDLYDIGHAFIYGMSVHDDEIFFSSDISGRQEVYLLDTLDETVEQVTSSKYGEWDPVMIDGRIYAIETISFDQEGISAMIPKIVESSDIHTGYVADYYDPDLLGMENLRIPDTLEGQPYFGLEWALTPFAWGVLLPTQFEEYSFGVRTADPFIDWITYASLGYIPESEDFSARLGINHYGDYLTSGLLGSLFYDTDGDLDYEISGVLSSTMSTERYNNSFSHQIGVFSTHASSYGSTYPISVGLFDTFSYGKTAPYLTIPSMVPGFSHSFDLIMIPEFPLGSSLPTRMNNAMSINLPSFIRDHSIELIGYGEWRNIAGLPSAIQPARGYERRDITPLTGSDGLLGTLGISYQFPIAYPDTSILSTAFIKRIRSELYFDTSMGSEGMLSTAGIELLADISYFNRKEIQFSTGLRVSLRLDDMQPAIELILLDVPIFLAP